MIGGVQTVFARELPRVTALKTCRIIDDELMMSTHCPQAVERETTDSGSRVAFALISHAHCILLVRLVIIRAFIMSNIVYVGMA